MVKDPIYKDPFLIKQVNYSTVLDKIRTFSIFIYKYIWTKIAISICTLFVLPAKISELDLKYMSRLGLAYSF